MASFHREATSNTSYHVDVTPPIILRIGEKNPAMEALLLANKCNEWAFITAFNPGSDTHNPEQNLAFNETLSQRIHDRGYKMLAGHDHSDSNAWPDEQSFLILGIERPIAREIGRDFGQIGIVCGRQGAAPELVYC